MVILTLMGAYVSSLLDKWPCVIVLDYDKDGFDLLKQMYIKNVKDLVEFKGGHVSIDDFVRKFIL